jgi:two-component system alkaline phosphatase synthesis response regulator PhoP
MIKARLEELGFEVITAGNGKDGVERAMTGQPDLAVIDTLLPDTDGFEVCRQIRSLAPSEKIKIIVMTGSVDAIDAVKARRMGADDYVVKTMDMELLETAVKGLI